MPAFPPALANRTWLARRFRRGGMFLVPGLVFSTGCLYQGKETTDNTVKAMAARPYDPLPDQLQTKPVGQDQPTNPNSQQAAKKTSVPTVPTDVQTVAFMQGQPPPKAIFQLNVPEAIPGSEVPLLAMPADPKAREAELARLYAPLPKLDEEIKPLPGPNGVPYTLADFQRIAAENSPTLKQAASDVVAAQGNLWQAKAYPNPNVALQEQASNNNSTGGAIGFTYDQVVITGGKGRLSVASAEKSLQNAELALRRARSDLSTAVRNAYFALLVAKETMRVTRALSVLTDEVYRVQLTYTQRAGQSAAYEPAALRAQAWAARLAYVQARATYEFAWKQLVSTVSVRQLPLSEVAGRIDAYVPYYEYDKVLGYILRNHTDMLTAQNGIDIQKYNLKVNQITPYVPNLDFNIGMFKDRALFPFGTYATFSVSAPLPFWDQNRGNILAAEGALARAIEEPHRVEMVLTNTLATNYTNYRTNLDAVEYYRRYVLPDQVIAYRGTLLRRQVDVNAQFGDLVAAQQALATSVTTYLGLLGTLWTSVISVADMLQTDDLFQTAEARGLPALPDLESLPPLPCCHSSGHPSCAAPGTPAPTTLPSPNPLPPAPMPAPAPTPVPKPMPMGQAPMGAPGQVVPMGQPGAGPQPPSGLPPMGPPGQVPIGQIPSWQQPMAIPPVGQAPMSVSPLPASAPVSQATMSMPGQVAAPPAASPALLESLQQGPRFSPGLLFIPGLFPMGRD